MPNTTCPACGHETYSGPEGSSSAGGGTCSRCGYASGESNRCPHCSALARIEGVGPSAVCAACGGPRVPSNFGGEAAAAALKQQRKLLDVARLASIATLFQALIAAIATLIGLAVVPASILGKMFVFMVALMPLGLAFRSRSRATAARASAKDASERAWQAAAEDVAARTEGGVTEAALAKTLGLELDHAERLLTSLAVHDRTRIDVGDDAEVRYSVGPDTLLEEPEDELASNRIASKEPVR